MSEILPTLIQAITIVILYMIIGFGPGFILGVLLANKLPGRNKPHRIDKHEENVHKAEIHNEQWNPDNQKWQK